MPQDSDYSTVAVKHKLQVNLLVWASFLLHLQQ